MPELALAGCNFVVLGCSSGKYIQLLDMVSYEPGWVHLLSVRDMNLNGIPEIVIYGDSFSPSLPYLYYRVLEWDGQQFQIITKQNDFESRYAGGGVVSDWIYSVGIGRGVDYIGQDLSFRDVDNNGTIEIVVNDGLPTSFDGMINGVPWRAETDIYMWNGQNFVLFDSQIEPPSYRFQAVQDADYASLDGEYEKALDLYQQVIFSDKLDWWSEKRRSHEAAVVSALLDGSVTPTPLIPDFAEYDYVAAYARFRIMLLHILRGWLAEAKIVYDTLQEKYPDGKNGHVYAELATAFWNEYQKSNEMGLACSRVIDYTIEQPSQILRYLGNVPDEYSDEESIYHGWQSKVYTPEDICPFK